MADGRLVVADFGLAVEEDHPVSFAGGTPRYLAPEVAMGERATFASDIWQLGVVMHEVLFLRRPTWEDRLRRRSRPYAAGAEEALAELCLRCLSHRPAARPSAAWLLARGATERKLIAL